MYGDTKEMLSATKVDVLELNPKVTVFETVDIENCEVEMQKGQKKLSWTETKEEKNKKKSSDPEDRIDKPFV